MTVLFRNEDEPALVLAFFPEAKGTVVEVGANDPTQLSQSRAFEERGWQAILVEPHPRYAQRLREQRKGRVFECACGRPEDAGTSLTLYLSGGESSVSTDLMQPHGLARVEGQVQVEVRTLDSILDEAQVESIDLLSIDVEGFELPVLQGIDLRRRRPRLVLLEDHLYDLTKHRHMTAQGYALMRRAGANSWYVPRDAAPPLSLGDRFWLWRKYYLGTPLRALRHRWQMWRARRAAKA